MRKIGSFDMNAWEYVETDFEHITKHDYWYSKENLIKLKYLSSVINGIEFACNQTFFQSCIGRNYKRCFIYSKRRV